MYLSAQEFQRRSRTSTAVRQSFTSRASTVAAGIKRNQSSTLPEPGCHNVHDFSTSTSFSSALPASLPDNTDLHLSDRVRRLMRRVPHPVAIVTSTDTSLAPNGGPEGWRGATVSSFNTVTLSAPSPIVSFNIKQLSSTYDAIRHSGKFRVHLLNTSDEAVEIATKFTKGNALSPFHADSGEVEHFARLNLRGDDDSDSPPAAPDHPPLIGLSAGATANDDRRPVSFSLLCRHLSDKTVEIADHFVVFGAVVETSARLTDELPQQLVGDSPFGPPCLIYSNGSFQKATELDRLDGEDS